VAVSRRSDLPALPPKKKCMGYLRMVSRLLPEHGLALTSDSYETGVAYWNDGVMVGPPATPPPERPRLGDALEQRQVETAMVAMAPRLVAEFHGQGATG
jgi:hypothetical protein